jgi:23S rRNA (uracil1939-C5)-methyltransferase
MALARALNEVSSVPLATPPGSISVSIDGIAAGGDGVGRLSDGRVAFVPRTAPGDRVRADIVRDGGRWIRARVVAVEHASDLRRDPPCPLFDRCGGCQLQHLTYQAQLDAKAQNVADALERIGGLEIERPVVEPSPQEFGYRNRVTFTLRRLRGGRVVAGFHAWERPARIVDVDARCLLPEAPIGEAWGALRERWGPGARLLPSGGELRITLRAGEGGVLLAVEGGEVGWTDAPELAEAVPALASIWHRPAARSEAWGHLAGRAVLDDPRSDGSVPVGPRAFVQVNRGVAETLQRRVLDEVGDAAGRRIVDAYAGMAVYGRHLAREGASVTAVELDPEAADAARRQAPPGLTVFQGRVEDRLAEALPADVVILNPPRTGLDARVPELLRAHPPPRMVYVSCDPATLARDLARLGETWAVRRVQAFDLFPQTAHVETVVTLEGVPVPT